MAGDNARCLATGGILCHVFEIEPVQVSETAVPAPNRDIAAADRQVVKPVNTTVPARSRHRKRPDRPAPGVCKNPGFVHVLQEGHENPGCVAVFTGDVGPVRHNLYMLVCQLPAVITIGVVIRADEPVAHGGVLCIRGIINLSQREHHGMGGIRDDRQFTRLL